MGWWMLFGGFLWIIFWVTVIYLIVTLGRGPERDKADDLDGPIDIGKRRYASGEITREGQPASIDAGKPEGRRAVSWASTGSRPDGR